MQNQDTETTVVIPRETMRQLRGLPPAVKARRAPRTLIAFVAGVGLTLASVAAFAAPVVQKGKSGETGLIKVATCNDGKEYWHKTNEHRGACSGHGGVASWADGSPVKSRKGSTEYR